MAPLAPGTKVLSAPIDAELHKQLRIRAVQEGRPLRAVVIDAVTAYLATEER